MQIDVDTKLQESVTLETALLKAMSNRHNFETYADSINRKRVLETTDILLHDYKKYFELYPTHKEIDFSIFFTQFSQTWHGSNLSDEDINFYRDYVFPAIEKTKGSEVESSLLGLLQKNTMDSLISLAKKDFCADVLIEELDRYKSKQSEIVKEYDDDRFTATKIDYSVLDKTKGIPWFMDSLQSGLGGLVAGQLVIVAAPSGAGKSAFVISQAVAAFIRLNETESTQPILYFNSEGTVADVQARFYSNLFKGVLKGGFEQVYENIDKVVATFTKKYNEDLFSIFQMEGVGVQYVVSKIKKYNPAFVIIDIADALAPEEDPKSLKKLYDTLRQVSNNHCPILITSQSKDVEYYDQKEGKTTNKKFLSQKDLHGSNVGKQGAADTIITIGKDDTNPLIRYINTPKKKRGQPVKITAEILEQYSYYQEFTF